jgi:ADP-ribose pyrophosphatase
MTIYLATELTQGVAEPMEDERIETKWFSKKQLRELIRTNKITDAKTMIGFLHWARL